MLSQRLFVEKAGLVSPQLNQIKRLAAFQNPEFLTMPVSWKGTLVQYAGRLHRLHPGKTEVRIYDYVDREVPLFQRMFEKRLRGYRTIGYARNDSPLDDEAGSGDATGVAGMAETPATPNSRKPRRPRTGRRLRQPSRAPW